MNGKSTTSAPNRPYRIGLIGCGKMGGAMASAWLASDVVSNLIIADPNGAPNALSSQNRVNFHSDIPSFLHDAHMLDLLMIAVKPQGMDAACGALKNGLPKKICVVSVAAGKTLSYFASHFGIDRPVIRAMPNTPAMIGKGVTVAIANASVPAEQQKLTDTLLGALGDVEWTSDEVIMDAVTALSGSGPAYVFYLIESMAQAGVESGLAPDMAMRLARQTVIGAAALAGHDPGMPVSALRENVTSPNGTTAAALDILMDGRLQSIMTEAVEKAAGRSRDLSR